MVETISYSVPAISPVEMVLYTYRPCRPPNRGHLIQIFFLPPPRRTVVLTGNLLFERGNRCALLSASRGGKRWARSIQNFDVIP
jgi:hypothetical protein